MTSETWNNLFNQYKNLYLPSRYAEHAQGMIDLIPHLEQHLNLHSAEVETSHATLVFRWSSLDTQMMVWFEKGKYKIYLNHPDKGSFNAVFVDFDHVVETLQNHLNELSPELHPQ